jgi:hypothetical protein
MRRAVAVIVALGLVVAACGDDDDAATPTTSTSGETTVTTSGTTQTIDDQPGTTSTSEPIPAPTPPPGQPAACALLSEDALATVGVSSDAPTSADDRPDGVPAPSTGCSWRADPGVSVALYYGIDPLEILATARQISPGGVDVSGVGQDAYYVTGVLFVDAGSHAFSVGGGPTQDQLEALARDVISNL